MKKEQKRISELKKEAALKQDINAFFNQRDKTNRGDEGLAEDVAEQSEVELEIKQKLYENSLAIHPLPEHFEAMFNSVVLTARRNKVITDGGLILSQGTVDGVECDYQKIQKVLAIGPQVQQVKEGMEVSINFDNFKRLKSESMADKVNKNMVLNIPTVTIDYNEYIMLSERDIEYIVDARTN